MSYGDRCTPTNLEKKDEDHIAITWADGKTSVFRMDFLRAKCPCANCIDELTGVVMVQYEAVKNTRIKRMDQVGTYAFSITFTDNHSTGIFTYRKLREWGDAL